ncbi:MAG: PLP-dependent cysteine synthase family protein [Candidatus Aquicultorales bacterium]
MSATSLLGLIGNTPVVEIKRLNTNPKVKLYAKLESFNPGGSVKDRIAKHMIEHAEKMGRLQPGQIVLEATSGNTGIGLAMVCSLKGYRMKIVMPETMSLERRQILQAFGAEFVLTPGNERMPGAIRKAHELSELPCYYFVDQFANEANPLAHYETTGPEILRDVPDIDLFVSGIGTGGTLMGAGRYLRENKTGVKIVAVEPHLKSKIQGLRNLSEGYVPPIWDNDGIDEKVNITDDEAFDMAKDLAKVEGILTGISSGAAMAEAVKRAESMDRGTIVVILPDGGDRYLSTDVFTCPYRVRCRSAEQHHKPQAGVVEPTV